MAAATGRLNGNEPDIFKGSRHESEDFLKEFDLLWEMNPTHTLFTVPYTRVMAALSYIRGTIVNDWVRDQIAITKDKINRANNPLLKTDEDLWTEFLANFKASFTDISIKEHSYRKMLELRMKGDRIDDYVARFKHLAREAGFPLTQIGTIDIFIKGIPKDILEKMLERDNNFNPDTATFDEWVKQAQEIIKKSVRNANIIGTAWPASWKNKGQHKSSWTPRSQTTSHRNNNSNSIVDGYRPMDVDVIRRTITDQEKEMYRCKGLCFECKQTGHMARYCPEKKKKPQQQLQGYKRTQYKQYKLYDSNKPKRQFGQQKSYNKSRTPFARIAQFLDSDDESEEEDTVVNTVTTSKSGNKELNISDIAARTSRFTDDQREEWVKEMKNLGVDF